VSVAAVHRADVSSASIPAVSFVISCIYDGALAPRKWNEAVDPAASIGVNGRRHPFPSVIASHSQLEEITWEMLLNGTA
jgi:hypothetical protein